VGAEVLIVAGFSGETIRYGGSVGLAVVGGHRRERLAELATDCGFTCHINHYDAPHPQVCLA
jgi:hypothetical protein